MSYETETSSTSASAERLLGRVKWFNSKAGYGFITVTDGLRSGTDIFVHHSSIGVQNQQYKYLIQGEYVEFQLSPVQDGAHKFSAVDVSGIKGGKLMCETRNDFKMNRGPDMRVNSSRFANDEVKPLRREGPRSDMNWRMK